MVKYGSEIDPQTKAGYTPLHTACHFGQINMIRFLLERGASVNATTKVGVASVIFCTFFPQTVVQHMLRYKIIEIRNHKPNPHNCGILTAIAYYRRI